MAYSPYQIAGTQASLRDLLQESRFRGEQSKSKTAVQMGKLEEEFEADLEAAQAKARRDSKKNKGLFQGLNLLGTLFLGPLGAGLTKGITAGIQGNQRKKALEGLLSDVEGNRWSKNFLKRPMKAYEEEAEDLQMSSGDVLRGAFGAGLTGALTSKMLGGESGKSVGGNIIENIKESGGLKEMFSPRRYTPYGSTVKGDYYKQIVKDPKFVDKLRGIFRGSQDLLSPISDSLQKRGSFKGGMEELQSAMMLPMLLQQILGE